jgi:hypothetical protein
MDDPSRCASAGNTGQTPGFAGIGQPNQQIGDLFVLGAQLRAIPIAGLAHPKRPASQRTTGPASRHRSLGHLAALTHGKSACMLRSAYIHFSRRFSSSIAFIWLIKDASMPPYFARHL